MKYKFLKFMKSRFYEQGDHCPIYDWEKFIANEFSREDINSAKIFTKKLIENNYIEFIKKDNGEYFAISGYGIEMIRRNKIDVDI